MTTPPRNALNSLLADAAEAHAYLNGERAIVTVKGGSPVEIADAIVLRGTRGGEVLVARMGNPGGGTRRLEHEVEVMIRVAVWPGGIVNKGGDQVAVLVRTTDEQFTEKTVSRIIGNDGVWWHLGMD